MAHVHTEKIADRERWLSVEPLTKEEVDRGLACCLAQIDANMDATKGLEYPIIDCIEWTDGFWTGLLWLAYEVTGDEKYRDRALENVQSFKHRVENRIELDHHDLGFLYVPSCVAAYRLTGSEDARIAALLAADKLMERWQPKGKFLQAWGPMDSPEHYRFIIDCMLNLPILYFASEETGDTHYRDVSRMHFDTTVNNIIREDGKVIPNLYAAGELVGGVMGDDSPAGANVGWALTSGRVAADAIAEALGKK